MKKTLFVALLACVTLMFASCSKEKTLNGTSWKTHTVYSEEFTEAGMTSSVNMTIDGTMKFVDATKGSMSMSVSGTITIPGFGSLPMEAETNTTDFTYTFDGEKGTMTGKDDEGTETTIPFTYNKKDNTILISQKEVDEETGLEFNLEMVFTEVK